MKDKKKPKKYKKNRFVCMKHLEIAYVYDRLEKKPITSIPYFRGIEDNEHTFPSLNIFEPDGLLKVQDIQYVKITVPESAILDINLKNYCYKGKYIKITKPAFSIPGGIKFIGLSMPVEIFRVLIADNHLVLDKEIDTSKLSFILHFLSTAHSVKLYDKKKKCLAYALQSVE